MPERDLPANLARAYKSAVLLLGALFPIAVAKYLSSFIDSNLRFESTIAHEAAVLVATLVVAIITFVAYQGYKKTGDPFLRFSTLAFLAVVLVYAPHGMLTRMGSHHLIAFLIFGPASRFMMSAYLFLALLHVNRKPDAPAIRSKPVRWWPHALLFIVIDVAVFVLATSSLGLAPVHLRAIEWLAFSVFLLSAIMTLIRKVGGKLMWFYLTSLMLLAQGSGAFLLARPWNHMWWLAHTIFAAGSLVFGSGIVRAYEAAVSSPRP